MDKPPRPDPPCTPKKSRESKSSIDSRPKTPTPRMSRDFNDRFIPGRSDIATVLLSPTKKRTPAPSRDNETEVLGMNNTPTKSSPIKSQTRSLFNYRSPTKQPLLLDSPQVQLLSPFSNRLLQSPRKAPRQIAKTPFKILDAPDLQDDFYLNLVDWSASNFLGVGLGSCVYVLEAGTNTVTKLCDIGPSDTVTSLAWNQKGTVVSVGTSKGEVQIWDIAQSRRIRTFKGHVSRVGANAWHSDALFSSGSKDGSILHRDLRTQTDSTRESKSHTQEVCGMKYNPSTGILATGGNDNKLLLWDARVDKPLHKFSQHSAAVKAIAWSPTQPSLLASGGGTADRTIRFFNTNLSSNNLLRSVDTGSQVCNIAWSKSGTELVSSHGYSQNQINVWSYKDMNITATLTGHSFRVLYLACSPNGESIVSGAGDETLRFWNVFQKSKARGGDTMHASQMR